VFDALLELPEGGISDAVETAYGFHVLRRLRPPAVGRLSGVRIVVGHDEAPWLKLFRSRRTIERSRDESVQLARTLAERLAQHPEEFGTLLQAHSDHVDARQGGDIGEWSTGEPTPLHRQLEVLSTLAVGAVSEPIETLLGFEILMRTPERPREQFAADVVRIAFDPQLPQSRTEAWKAGHDALSALQARATSMAALQQRFCCSRTERWREGREHPDLTAAVASLAVGAFSPAPIQVDNNVVVLQRRPLEP
jgi:parvulin-like peptidyl-prolyl isomerase